MDKLTLKRAVVFAILMEGDGGVTNKSPEYVGEKFTLAMNSNHPKKLLDKYNKIKFKKWIELWGIDL